MGVLYMCRQRRVYSGGGGLEGGYGGIELPGKELAGILLYDSTHDTPE